jgi:hypothetical protein
LLMHTRPSVVAVFAGVGEPHGRALLRAEPLTRTDSWITSMAESQHKSARGSLRCRAPIARMANSDRRTRK